jgi:thiol-disulfide isomerase/thioredoxin
MLEISDEDGLNKFLAGNKKALVLFFASWCPYSRAFRPIFESGVTKIKDCAAAIAVVDEDDNPLWDRCEVEYVPTVVYFKNGKISKYLAETAGQGLSRKELLDFLKLLG